MPGYEPLSNTAVKDKVERRVKYKEEVVQVAEAKPAARQTQSVQPARGNKSDSNSFFMIKEKTFIFKFWVNVKSSLWSIFKITLKSHKTSKKIGKKG